MLKIYAIRFVLPAVGVAAFFGVLPASVLGWGVLGFIAFCFFAHRYG